MVENFPKNAENFPKIWKSDAILLGEYIFVINLCKLFNNWHNLT